MYKNSEIIKECKETLDGIKLEDLQKSINLIREDNSYCYSVKLYNDYDNKDFYFCIGVDEEKNVIYKFGFIDTNMILDITDFTLPYDEDGNIYDTECMIDNNINSKEWQFIKNHAMPDFIRFCTKHHILNKKCIWE